MSLEPFEAIVYMLDKFRDLSLLFETVTRDKLDTIYRVARTLAGFPPNISGMTLKLRRGDRVVAIGSNLVYVLDVYSDTSIRLDKVSTIPTYIVSPSVFKRNGIELEDIVVTEPVEGELKCPVDLDINVPGYEVEPRMTVAKYIDLDKSMLRTKCIGYAKKGREVDSAMICSGAIDSEENMMLIISKSDGLPVDLMIEVDAILKHSRIGLLVAKPLKRELVGDILSIGSKTRLDYVAEYVANMCQYAYYSYTLLSNAVDKSLAVISELLYKPLYKDIARRLTT